MMIEQTNTAEDRGRGLNVLMNFFTTVNMLSAKRAVQDIDQMQQFEEGLHRIREYREISPSIVRLFICSLHVT